MYTHPWIELLQLLWREQLHLCSNTPLNLVILPKYLLSSLRRQEQVATIDILYIRRIISIDVKMLVDVFDKGMGVERQLDVLFE